MFRHKILCKLGRHTFETCADHPFCKAGFEVRECRRCKFTQAREDNIPWYEISGADQLQGYNPPKVIRS